MPRKSDRDWKAAGERALTTALNKADKLADSCGDTKQLVDLIKTIGEIVGTGIVLGRKPSAAQGSDDDEQE